MPFDSVDTYIAAQPAVVQTTLARLRSIILSAVPNAEETIAYDMPTYKRDGKRFIHFAGWKNHVSLYAMNATVRSAFADELAGQHVEGSTIRFSYGEPLPEDLIRRLVAFRAGI